MMWTASVEFAESEGYTACRSNWLLMTHDDRGPWCIISTKNRDAAMGRRTERSRVRDQVLPTQLRGDGCLDLEALRKVVRNWPQLAKTACLDLSFSDVAIDEG